MSKCRHPQLSKKWANQRVGMSIGYRRQSQKTDGPLGLDKLKRRGCPLADSTDPLKTSEVNSEPALIDADAALQGEVEVTIGWIWTEVLNNHRIGRNDTFFELGGNSVQAMQVVVRLRQALGIEVEIADIFTYPVLCKLADHILTMQLEQFDSAEMNQLLESMKKS
jgi:acyl carrier protein